MSDTVINIKRSSDCRVLGADSNGCEGFISSSSVSSPTFIAVLYLVYFSILKMEAACYSELSVMF
jgi:hypothetical protein